MRRERTIRAARLWAAIFLPTASAQTAHACSSGLSNLRPRMVLQARSMGLRKTILLWPVCMAAYGDHLNFIVFPYRNFRARARALPPCAGGEWARQGAGDPGI